MKHWIWALFLFVAAIRPSLGNASNDFKSGPFLRRLCVTLLEPLNDVVAQSSWPSEIKIRVGSRQLKGIPMPFRPYNYQLILEIHLPADLNLEENSEKLGRFFRVPKSKVLKVLQSQVGPWISVNQLLPKFFGKAGADGPVPLTNCWNTAFRFHGVALLPCYMTESSALIRLGTAFRPVDLKSEKLEFGDLIAVWDRNYPTNESVKTGGVPGGLKHLVVYAGGEIVFQKDGLTGGYEFAEFGPAGVNSGTGGYSGILTVYRKR